MTKTVMSMSMFFFTSKRGNTRFGRDGSSGVCSPDLAAGLAERGHEVPGPTRRDEASLPDRVVVQDGYNVVHVTAGPAEQLPKDELLQHMPAFARVLRHGWAAARPDVVHAHFWMSGLASVEASASLLEIGRA